MYDERCRVGVKDADDVSGINSKSIPLSCASFDPVMKFDVSDPVRVLINQRYCIGVKLGPPTQ